MKKLAIILISIVATAVLVAVGWWFGFQQRLLTEAYAVPLVEKQITEAAMLTRLIDNLDSGRLEDTKHLLALQLDGHILTIDSLLDYTDARTRESALKIFTGIVEYRAKNPASYTGHLAQAGGEVDAKIASILRRAKEQTK
jgi:hypothetical protein